MKEFPTESLLAFFLRELHKANTMLEREPVVAGYVSPWLKIQKQYFVLAMACKKELGKTTENLTALEEIGL